MSGLFDTFTIAKRGLAVQQSNINTNAHNMANAKTEGYSRQRSVTETTRAFGGNDKYAIGSAGQVGTGAEVTNIMRIRDTFIDYQMRNENGKLGNYEVQSKFLSQVDDVFGEPSTNGIQNLFSEFYAAFGEVAKTPEKSSSRTVAIQKADSLANALNQTYSSLQKKITDAQDLLQQNVLDVNSMLNQINSYNEEIKSVSSVAMSPNDLMDKRDNLLDKLSHMFGITVSRDEKNTINLKMDGFPKSGDSINNLVNSDPTDQKYTRFSYLKGVNVKTTDASGLITKIEVEYYPLGDSKAATKKVEVTGTDLADLKKSLEQNRVLVADKDGNVGEYDASGNFTAFSATTTDVKFEKSALKIYEYDSNVNNVDPKAIKGEIAGNQSVQNMVKGYMDELDKVAKCLAYSVNAIQTGNDGTTQYANLPTIANNLVFVNSDTVSLGINNSDDGISAKNISVNVDIIKDVFKLNCAKENGTGEKENSRAQAIVDLSTIKIDISNIDISLVDTRKKFFSGVTVGGVTQTFGVSSDGISVKGNSSGKEMSSYYKDMISALGTKEQEAKSMVNKQTEDTIYNLQQQRMQDSGVSLDEEMSDLVQFQHAYQANAKMIATIDELLDVVINQLKR